MILKLIILLSTLFFVFNLSNSTSLDGHISDGHISIELSEINVTNAQMKLINDTPAPIYLFYEIEGTRTFLQYSLKCFDNGPSTEIEYATNYHTMFLMNSVASKKILNFDIKIPFEAAGRTCKLTLVYFDNPEVFEILSNRPLATTIYDQTIIEREKKVITKSFKVPEI